MNDEPKAPPATPTIKLVTEQQVMEHLGKLLDGIDYKCPICTNKTFIFAREKGDDGRIVPYQLVASLTPAQTFATLPFVCENCGYVTFFASKVIGDKIAKPE